MATPIKLIFLSRSVQFLAQKTQATINLLGLANYSFFQLHVLFWGGGGVFLGEEDKLDHSTCTIMSV